MGWRPWPTSRIKSSAGAGLGSCWSALRRIWGASTHALWDRRGRHVCPPGTDPWRRRIGRALLCCLECNDPIRVRALHAWHGPSVLDRSTAPCLTVVCSPAHATIAKIVKKESPMSPDLYGRTIQDMRNVLRYFDGTAANF